MTDTKNALAVVLDRGRDQFAVALQGGPVSLGDFEVAVRAAAMSTPDLLVCMAQNVGSRRRAGNLRRREIRVP